MMLRGGLANRGITISRFFNLYAVRRTILGHRRAIARRQCGIHRHASNAAPVRTYTVVAAVLVGTAAWRAIQRLDRRLRMARRGIPFREIEFYFQRDLGHYVYWLPLEQTLYVWALLATSSHWSPLSSCCMHSREVLKLDGKRMVASTHARRHLTVLGSLMLHVAWRGATDWTATICSGSGTGNDGLFLRIDHLVAVND